MNRTLPHFIVSPLMIAAFFLSVSAQSIVNFNHLRHLTERIPLNNDSVAIIHIYADYPSYQWVDASGEGIACVDDAARAAVAYLRHYELTNNQKSATRAKELLKFVHHLQADDGQFYNFIYADHTINRNGSTSYKSLGWWAARGVWCFGLGYRIFEKEDPQFASLLKRGIEKTFFHLDTLLRHFGKKKIVAGYLVPQWLLYESGSDATTELVLGLLEYYKATNDFKVKVYIEQLCNGMIQMQNGDVNTFPYGLHRSWETLWHAWGNGQTQVLAEAGKVLRNQQMIESARREADGFYSRLLIQGFQREFDVVDTSKRREFEQIAYDLRPIVVGLVRLYEATTEKKYLTMAEIAASWFFGNNAAASIMYDTASGRGYDGIRSPAEVNKNSGAESTIEALLAIMELERFSDPKNFMHIKKILSGENKKYLYGIFLRNNERLGLVVDKVEGGVSVLTGKALYAFEEKLLG